MSGNSLNKKIIGTIKEKAKTPKETLLKDIKEALTNDSRSKDNISKISELTKLLLGLLKIILVI